MYLIVVWVQEVITTSMFTLCVKESIVLTIQMVLPLQWDRINACVCTIIVAFFMSYSLFVDVPIWSKPS